MPKITLTVTQAQQIYDVLPNKTGLPSVDAFVPSLKRYLDDAITAQTRGDSNVRPLTIEVGSTKPTKT